VLLLLLLLRLLLLCQGKLPAMPGQRPTMGDWENHLTTIFPEVSNLSLICYDQSVMTDPGTS
jgi:hypothetical protein